MIFQTRLPLLSLGFAAFMLLSLAACGGTEEHFARPSDTETTTSGAVQLSPVPPPALSDEMKPVLQHPQTEVWRPGHWIYENQRFEWMAGEILTRPSPTAVWSPDRWEHRGFGWAYIHGYWQ
jgi:hypothetical protein